MAKNTSNHSPLSSSAHPSAAVPRRQERGARRIEQLLDSAALVFARDGYAMATTNAIAVEAGVSPGTLYQFFRNKGQIAEALAQRLVQRLGEVQASIEPLDARGQPLAVLVESITARFMAFHRANPAFEALLLGADTSAELAGSMQALYADLLARLQEIIRSRAPASVPTERCRLIADVCILIFKAMLQTALQADPLRVSSVEAELKLVLVSYLGSALGSGA